MIKLLTSLLAPLPAILIVAVGGAIGAVCRWGTGMLYLRGGLSLPLATLSVNIAGCFLLGAAFGALPAEARELRLFTGVGMLGSFTTFSTFGFESMQLLENTPSYAAIYIVLHLILCLTASFVGIALTR